ncbi:MAG: hypothetical protein E6Q44_13410 [Flavobacteriales bacterium]|jgi:hypothetical protein|nr:MAG: hypothetical protein E6Q44_13410 [Flavobacteriales bacterium]
MNRQRSSPTSRSWFFLALANLLVATLIGVLLRTVFIGEVPFIRFRPWLHAHSHVAMLGWLFPAIVVALMHDGGRHPLSRRSHHLLTALQIAVVLMLLSFPVQGYGAVSITASTLHLVLSYMALAMLWRLSLQWPKQGSGRLTRWAIILYVLSSLGVWTMAPLIATGNQGKEVYYWAVQFYLHFQFNGWYWFAAMALGARWAERQGFALRIDGLTLGLWVASALLTYALAIAWSEPHPAVFATVSLGVILQLWAALRTLGQLRKLERPAHDRLPTWVRVLVGVALISMALKVLVQVTVAVPAVAVMALTIRHYVMGFIHMNTLATMTTLLLAYALTQGWLDVRATLVRAGLVLVVIGIIGSELMLFAQGTLWWAGLGMIPGHYIQLAVVSTLIPVGVAALLFGARGSAQEQRL